MEEGQVTTGDVLAETLIANLERTGYRYGAEEKSRIMAEAAKLYDEFLAATAQYETRHKTLYIIRGLPGSGKSAMAASVAQAVASEDDFFGSAGGGYSFDPRRRYQGIGWMTDQALALMDRGVNRAALATCALTLGELSPVKQAADERGYRVFSCVLQNTHGKRSVHGVDERDYEWMRRNMAVTLDMSRDPETVWKNKEGK